MFHGRRVHGFHADHLDFGTDLFDVGRDSRDKTASADRDENSVDRSGMLPENFHTDSALSGDDVRVVEGMNKRQMTFLFQCQGVFTGVGKRFTEQNDFHIVATVCLDRFDFYRRRRSRHGDHGFASQSFGSQCHALGVIA